MLANRYVSLIIENTRECKSLKTNKIEAVRQRDGNLVSENIYKKNENNIKIL